MSNAASNPPKPTKTQTADKIKSPFFMLNKGNGFLTRTGICRKCRVIP